jgi:hypothetical protein
MTAFRTHLATHRTVAPVLVAAALLLTACGASGGSGTATTTTKPDPAGAAKALRDSVDATLGTPSFSVDGKLKLEIGTQLLRLSSMGSIDYKTIVGDLLLNVDSTQGKTELDIRTNGKLFWIRAQGSQAPVIPDGKTWIQGNASRLRKSSSLDQKGLIGVILALRGARTAKQVGTGNADGIATTTYETTVAYDAAVKAAGSDADAFTSSLSLRVPKTPDLAMKVEVGSDGIIRSFDLDVKAKGGTPLDGSYVLTLSDVNKKLKAPDAPPAADTLTGPQAERLLDQLVK